MGYELNFIHFSKATGLVLSKGRCLLKNTNWPNYDYVGKMTKYIASATGIQKR